MRTVFSILGVSTTVCLSAGVALAAPVSIDTFDSPGFFVVGAPTVAGSLNPASDAEVAAAAIGNHRRVTNERTTTGPTFGNQVQTTVTSGFASIATVGSAQGTSTFQWGSASPLGADLVDGTNTLIGFDILQITDPVNVTLTLDGQSLSQSATSTGLFSFVLADFDTTTLTAVDQISFEFTLGTNVDVQFDTVRAFGDGSVVPLPASGWLLVGALGAVAWRRRAKGIPA